MSPTTSALVAPAAAPPPAPRLFAGASVGAALPLADFGPAVAPSVEAGAVLPVLGGRLLPFVGVAYLATAAEGTGEGYAWSLRMHLPSATAGLRVRVLPWTEAISPELSVGPTFAYALCVAGGERGGAAFPVTREGAFTVGISGAAGLAVRAGPGQFDARLGFTALPVSGVLTGSTIVSTLTPSAGYRILR